ncbi:MAG: cupin domain-containing protein [Candidatus Thorarchaeota archaeon]
MKVLNTKEIDWKKHPLVPEVSAKLVTGKNVMAQLVRLEKGATMEPHKHAEEQLGYVLEGKIEFLVGPDKELHVVGAGSFFFFSSNEVHEVRSILETALVVDVFSPIRKDYLDHAFRMHD